MLYQLTEAHCTKIGEIDRGVVDIKRATRGRERHLIDELVARPYDHHKVGELAQLSGLLSQHEFADRTLIFRVEYSEARESQ